MSLILNKMQTVAAQLAGVAIVLSLDLGHSYMTEGYGLHPMLAGAIALAFVIAPYHFPRES